MELPYTDDDPDYIPEKRVPFKRKAGTQLQKKAVKQRKVCQAGRMRGKNADGRLVTSTTTLGFPTVQKGSRCVSKSGGKAYQPKASVSYDSQDESDVPLRRRKKDVHSRLIKHEHETKTGSGGKEHEPARRKNTEMIFGIPRSQELSRPLERAANVQYAWSAESAEYAAVSERAHVAWRADRVVVSEAAMDIKEANQRRALAMQTLSRLQKDFEAVEDGQKSSAAQDAIMAKFAGCADWALCATEAKEATFALEVTGCAECD